MSEFQREVVSGVGPWQIVFYNGRPMRCEVMGEDGRAIVFGHRPFDSTCARCGDPIKSSTPTNEDLDCCERCEHEVEAEIARGEHG